ncbi:MULTISPECIES: DUF1097 domain-containing protein [unclassified Mesorhizobium]|uniref:DUF1097 domain-containing protein n=1 Tax=unclassified Mesorhizobium TaxID=325217 RepID=UPI000FD22688|nr:MULTISPECIES: DUF1097 domain-containing protein [unclassified Mesorhizobium]RVB80447.1 DUF1097 domain-containing protein [Mesorhizobium sp. M6A.T.Cr.TU.014.01.1.1]RWQ10549.1 MAG: DUF1097 domain-containing protein [Mesorhizobium sp.]RWQ10968.1 MAG: DUF1097 domain-containing protein [Mesorhizobium sp.]
MDLITGLAVVIGIMGGIATWAAITIGNPYLPIWAVFVGWGSFYHCGGKEAGFKNSALANLWGAICAAGALIALTSIGVTALTAGICVGVSIVILILAAKLPLLSAIPSAVYGLRNDRGTFSAWRCRLWRGSKRHQQGRGGCGDFADHWQQSRLRFRETDSCCREKLI